MPAVKPEMLVWARENAHLPPEEAARRLGIKDARGVSALSRLTALEDGSDVVTRPMLLKMAKQYRLPLLAFYLSRPPRRGDRGEDFRNLPERSSDAEGLIDALVRDVRARQGIVRSILEDDEDAQPLAFIGSASMDDGLDAVLRSICRVTGLDLAEFRAQASPEAAFAYLRGRVEAVGIFVLLAGNLGSHHTVIDLEVFRGLALADGIAPFIVVNDQDARPAWSFSLLHELVHLWLGATGVSGAYSDARVERFCNDVAGGFLLPANELPMVGVDRGTDPITATRLIEVFAAERHLSRSMVAYRLFRSGAMKEETWRSLYKLFRSQWQLGRVAQRERARDREGGPNYYVVRRHRLGAALLKFAARNLRDGALTPTKAGKVLGVKPRSVDRLLSGAALPFGEAA